MNISATKAAIATALEGVSGITRVYATAPNSLPPGDIPAAVVYTGPSTYAERGYQVDSETRQFPVRVYVHPTKEGVPGESEALCEPLFAAVRAAFPAGSRLNRLPGVLEVFLTGDGGVVALPLGGSTYLGIQFTLEVMT